MDALTLEAVPDRWLATILDLPITRSRKMISKTYAKFLNAVQKRLFAVIADLTC
jgi:hypothetical protein